MEGSENMIRWICASTLNMLTSQGCPFPLTDLRQPPANREGTPHYIEVNVPPPQITVEGPKTRLYTIPVQLLVSSIGDADNLYWYEQVVGWAVRLFVNCYEVKSHPMILAKGTVQKSGNGSSLGTVQNQGKISIDPFGPLENLNRAAVTTVYTWEHKCESLMLVL